VDAVDINLTALRQIGFTANRRMLGVQRISHDPIRGAQAFTDLTTPIVTTKGTRIPGLRFGDTRVHALLQALLIHRLLPPGFTNRDLRTLIAPLLGTTTEDITAGKMTYDLRRLRAHGLICRVPRTRRYQPTITCSAPDWPKSPTRIHPPHPGCAAPHVPTKPPSTNSPTTPTSRPDYHTHNPPGAVQTTPKPHTGLDHDACTDQPMRCSR
jgi:hypothetical protein